MARCYADENFPLPVTDALRKLGHDVLTAHESGRANAATPDADVLAFALGDRRALLTLNRRHFIRLHGTTPDHAGIVVCTYDPDFDALADRIHAALAASPDLSGRLLRVNRPG